MRREEKRREEKRREDLFVWLYKTSFFNLACSVAPFWWSSTDQAHLVQIKNTFLDPAFEKT